MHFNEGILTGFRSCGSLGNQLSTSSVLPRSMQNGAIHEAWFIPCVYGAWKRRRVCNNQESNFQLYRSFGKVRQLPNTHGDANSWHFSTRVSPTTGSVVRCAMKGQVICQQIIIKTVSQKLFTPLEFCNGLCHC